MDYGSWLKVKKLFCAFVLFLEVIQKSLVQENKLQYYTNIICFILSLP